jgi:hypothetical protein
VGDVNAEILHITNGDSAATTLRQTALGGTVMSWQDVLHEGPLASVPPAELRRMRARFLAEQGWGDAGEIEDELRARDELFEQAVRERRPIVLWFEHDLFDQLQLLQILARLGEAAPGAVELVQADWFLGNMNAAELERLWERRVRVTPEHVRLAGTAWEAVCSGDLEAFLDRTDTSALPYLEPALQRLHEERQPLPRTKRQLLAALAEGPKRPLQVFAENQTAEEASFLGDAWAFLHLWELHADGLLDPVAGSMPLPPPRGDYEAFASTLLELTPSGRALVSTA